MERIIALLLALLLGLPTAGSADSTYQAHFQELGIPLSQRYPDGSRARTAWDVEIFDNKLFVASGDYDANSGPVSMVYYDLQEQCWVECGDVPDEQIEQFYIIDGKLMAPGSDPRQDHSLGNIYRYENSQWVTDRIIPGGIHQLDMVEFDGRIFVGLGVVAGQYPIAVSDDGGITYAQVPMYRDGMLLDTSVPPLPDGRIPGYQLRVYDFLTLNGRLFALYYRYFNRQMELSLYEYKDNAFHYAGPLPSNITFKQISYEPIAAKAEFGGRLFFTTGKLYGTDDMTNCVCIGLGEKANVTDLQVVNNALYATAITQLPDGQFRTTLWVNDSGKYGTFRQVFYFDYPVPAQSFVWQDGVFYFGMGGGTKMDCNPANGTILAVKCEN